MSVKLLSENHLELLSLTGGCTGSSESTLVKMPHCWKSHVMAQLYLLPPSMIMLVHLVMYRLVPYIENCMKCIKMLS